MVHLGCMRQQPFELPANVAFGSKATVRRCPRYFRFTLESRHSSQGAACLKGAISDILHREKQSALLAISSPRSN
jgi:hypothetical protein